MTIGLIVFSRDELKQAQMRERFPDPRLDFFLGDVRDLSRLRLAFDRANVVIHAAALKRVDSVAHDPDEVYKTNIQGVRNVLQAARGICQKVLFISSDKACYPTNAYGLSKAVGESLSVSFNVYGYPAGTISSVVRWGNVLGSRGSVLPVWRDQLRRGQAMTLTHPDMTRFIITMPEAIALVDHALREMEGGEIFVPNLMAARMVDLAAALTDMPVHVSALRPGGEKLHETLMTKEEGARLLEEKPCWVIGPDLTPWRDRRWHYSGAMQPRGCASMEMGQITSQYTNKLTVEELREKVKGVPDV